MLATDATYILKNPELEKSQQYSYLRELGIGYIEKLAHEIWTDYNVHDPGITFLEFLSYAITDLGYRTSYDMKDLLTEETESGVQNTGSFHTARDIFSVNPTSFNDLRKWLIDIDGVRNAWISINKNVNYVLDPQEGKLVDKKTLGRQVALDPLNGLYDVLLEYEDYVAEAPREAHLGILQEENPPLAPGSAIPTGQKGMRFKMRYPALLKQVHVYADDSNLNPGDLRQVTIRLLRQLENGTFSEVESQTQRLKVADMGKKTALSLDFELEAHTTYLLDAEGSILQLYKRDQGDFPYRLWQVAELLGGHDGGPRPDYFFFYDWVFSYAISPVQAIALQQADPIPAQAGRPWQHPPAGGSFITPDERKLVFDAFCPLTLDSVNVYAESSGKVVLRLLDDTGIQIGKSITFTVETPLSLQTIPLGWEILPGTGYQIDASGSGVRLYRHSNAAYPYETIPALEIIHGRTQAGAPTFNQYYFFYNWQVHYQPRLPEVASLTQEDIRRAAVDRVHEVRNLCEDFMHIRDLEKEIIGLCAEIGLRPEVDIEEILAEIFFQLEWHISPPVNFYTIEELKAKGRFTDQIFEGPLLDHGFIDDTEFRELERRCFLATSDILQLIMKVPGVETVKEISLLSFVKISPGYSLKAGEVRVELEGVPYKVRQEPWILELQEQDFFAPDFQPERSKIIFYKNGLPYLPNLKKVKELYEEKRASQIRNRLKGHENDLPVPLGTFRDLDDYYPVQNELPVTYRTGWNRVPDSATELRKAQSRQLKAFLLFFEQQMANYLSQLANIRALFSWEKGADSTYFTQAVTDIADAEELYIDYPHLGDDLKKIIETEDVALERKNRFLDHLLGRFCEDFTDYALIKYGNAAEKTPEWRAASHELIHDKQCFLQDYPRLSAGRGKAFDYRVPNPHTLTGYHRRMYRLMGIRGADCEIGWRNFASERFVVQQVAPSGKYAILLLPEASESAEEEIEYLFRSSDMLDCETREQYCGLLDNLLVLGAKRENWRYNDASNPKGWELYQICEKEEGTSRTDVFGLAPAAEKDESYLQEKIVAYFYDYARREGFHLIEHILLRKRTVEDAFMPVEIHAKGDGCQCVEVEDPYSFRASVILPSWPERFQQVRFRQYVEKILRMEAPAHVYLKICWISHCEMKDFEADYEKWLDQHAALPDFVRKKTGPTEAWLCARGSTPLQKANSLITEDKDQMMAYGDALEKLIRRLHSLTTVFPMASLHSCDEETGGEPPMTLNNTRLGSL